MVLVETFSTSTPKYVQFQFVFCLSLPYIPKEIYSVVWTQTVLTRQLDSIVNILNQFTTKVDNLDYCIQAWTALINSTIKAKVKNTIFEGFTKQCVGMCNTNASVYRL